MQGAMGDGLELAEIFSVRGLGADESPVVAAELPLPAGWRCTAGKYAQRLAEEGWAVGALAQARWRGARVVSQHWAGRGTACLALDESLSVASWRERLAQSLPEQVQTAGPGLSPDLAQDESGLFWVWWGVRDASARAEILAGARQDVFSWWVESPAEPGEQPRLCLSAASRWMDEATARALVRALASLWVQYRAAPDELPLTALNAIDSESFALLRQPDHEWVTPPLEPSVHHLLARLTREHPQRTALRWVGGSLTYAELDAQAHTVAQALVGLGVARGDCVGLNIDRSALQVVVLLGILKAGAVYMPLDSRYPPERLGYMLQDGRVSHILAEPCHARILAEKCSDQPARIWTLQSAADLPQPESAVALPDAAPEDAAYVLFTSGSTGQPKGIAVPHRGILRLVHQANYMTLNERTVMLQAAPLGFDLSTLEIWGPLLNGGVCVLLMEEVPTAAGLRRTIEACDVNSSWLTAALFNAVVDEDATALRGLKELLIGGEALSVPHVRRALAALPDTHLINGYGPTECTTFATCHPIPRELLENARSVPIGRAINNTWLFVVSNTGQMLPPGLVGELLLGGPGLAHGYVGREALTRERFVSAVPWLPDGERLYRTGDLVRRLPDGTLDYIGRADGQVKIRGFRIETAEIEVALSAHESVKACAVVPQKLPGGGLRLAAYVVPEAAGQKPDWSTLKTFLGDKMPSFMVPSAWVALEALPVTTNGKLDRRALPAPSNERPDLPQPYSAPRDALEGRVCDAFAQALGYERVGRLDNFFDLGGNSLLALRVLVAMGPDARGERVSATTFFRQPVPAALAQALRAEGEGGVDAHRMARRPLKVQAADDASSAVNPGAEPVAIIGMAARLPGAADVETFWANLLAERESITRFSPQELDPSLPAHLVNDPAYVPARGVVEGVEFFDAGLFGISQREAELMDPQQRVLLELAWACMEHAGYAPDATPAVVGTFAGMYTGTYFLRHVQSRPDLVEKFGEFLVTVANDKDYVATRIAHRLNLTGLAVSVNTACSTSLVAVAQAVTALRAGQCDMALAGGAAITCPPNSGYVYQEGAMLSPDGRTRTFSADAQGTVFSDGAALVLLKRLSDAQADGDTIYAVLRGVAVNNDGRDKASFTAPSVDGQAAVIAAAQDDAGVDARAISYVEAHGTATPLGDPIEVEGLRRAFARHSADAGYCRIGSVKTNLGHTVIAAGAAGLIKTALSLAHERIPASLNHAAPHPSIDFGKTPFVVNTACTPWPRSASPRLAGVSSFGVGGTNAHVVVQEAPLVEPSSPAVGPQLLLLSARTPQALRLAGERLADHLAAHPQANLADVAHTLQGGRSRMAERLCVVADTAEQAVRVLRAAEGDDAAMWRAGRTVPASLPKPVWMFTGQGSQYIGMGQSLSEADTVFRAALDDAMAAVQAHLPFDLRACMWGDDADALRQTRASQPATFCLQLALARAWQARGVQPECVLGHSVGEFAAAVVAGVMSLADAARLVATRGSLMQALPSGAMLSVRLPASELQAWLPEGVDLAAENAPRLSVAAGPTDLIEGLRASLEARGVVARVLHTSHAFHSAMMDPAVEPFEAAVRTVKLSAPQIPVISAVTGELLAPEMACDPAYWARHLRAPVRFGPAVATAQARVPEAAFMELGPRDALCSLARQQLGAASAAALVLPSLGEDAASEVAHMALALGRLWTAGVEPGIPVARPAHGRRRIPLPTYAFEQRRCWLPAGAPVWPQAPAEVAAPATAGPTSSPASGPSALPASNPPALSTLTVPPMPTPTSSAAAMPIADRRPRLIAELQELFADVAGMDLPSDDPAVGFLELGMDSLTLTQAALQIKRQYGVNLSFRQLMQAQRNFGTLAEWLDAQLPPDAPAASAATGAVEPSAAAHPVQPEALPLAQAHGQPLQALVAQVAATTAPLAGGQGPAAGASAPLQWLIAQQLQLMAQQLSVLGQGAAAGGGLPGAASWAAVAPSGVSAPADGAKATAEPSQPAAEAPAAAASSAAPAVDEQVPVTYDVKKAFGAIARIHKEASALDDRQRQRLEAFAKRYADRTARSKAYTQANRAQLADPRVVNGFRPMTKEITYQIVVERSKGSRVWDLDGHEYVDVLNGFGMNLFGWQPDFIQDAVREQLDRGYEIGPQHPLAGEVAALICELTGMDRAGLCNTGSEAVMAAIRIARTVTGRNLMVTFTGDYHGTFDEVVVRAGRASAGIPAAPGIMRGAFGDVKVLDYGTPEALAFIREHGDEIAAVLVEPVQSRRPDFQPREFLQELRKITEAQGNCLIFDEVITGFRSHPGGAQALFGVRADLATYGKVIGGGMPIGVVAGKREYMDALDGGAWQFGDDSIPTVGVTYFAGTFVRHPLALAAAKASLTEMKRQGEALQRELNLHTAAMAAELTAYCKEVGAPIAVRHFASLWRVTWLEDHPLQDLLFAMMRIRGIHILDNFPCFLTTAHSADDIARIKRAFKEAVAELQDAEFLPAARKPAATVADASMPPVPDARLGRDKDGRPTWYVPDPTRPGKYVKLEGNQA
jgi:amino acid adenylation domain-containing protein